MNIIPVILCGGSGTRLWPLSRRSKPKQFLDFDGKGSLFLRTVQRCQKAIFDHKPIILASNAHRFLVAEELRMLDIDADIVLEPVPKNSCAAIAAGALQAQKRHENATILVLSADHFIPDHDAFARAVELANKDAQSGYLVTFGVKPTRAETGYGYIRQGVCIGTTRKCAEFVEKPQLKHAQELIDQQCLWNSGNFLFTAKNFLDELQLLQSDILKYVTDAFQTARKDLHFIRLDETAFKKTPSLQVDHAIMEKTKKASVLAVDYAWSDIGSWETVAQLGEQDNKGNVTFGNTHLYDARNNIVHSKELTTNLIGVSNMAVISTKDCVLVVPKDRAQDVKTLVAELDKKGARETYEALKMFRPWGHYERLDTRPDYQVKRITVNPQGVLSLQKHKFRAEHWVVVSGKGLVHLDGKQMTLVPRQSVCIPEGAVHRLSNPYQDDLILIEIQTGSYFGEDDIIRLDDQYKRGDKE